VLEILWHWSSNARPICLRSIKATIRLRAIIIEFKIATVLLGSTLNHAIFSDAVDTGGIVGTGRLADAAQILTGQAGTLVKPSKPE
jgi:hypothetical protein